MNRRLTVLLASALLCVAGPAAAAGDGLQIFPDLPTLALLLILFVLLIPLTDRLLFRPLLGVLEERERRIDGTRTRAGELAAQASELLGRYQSAIRDARAQADGERRSRLEGARREQAGVLGQAREAAERQLAQTRREVEEAVSQARLELRREADGLAQEVAARLLDRGIE